jgi:hypothetical protein
MISNYIACGYQSCNQPVRETAHFLAMKLGDDTLFTFHGAKRFESKKDHSQLCQSGASQPVAMCGGAACRFGGCRSIPFIPLVQMQSRSQRITLKHPNIMVFRCTQILFKYGTWYLNDSTIHRHGFWVMYLMHPLFETLKLSWSPAVWHILWLILVNDCQCVLPFLSSYMFLSNWVSRCGIDMWHRCRILVAEIMWLGLLPSMVHEYFEVMISIPEVETCFPRSLECSTLHSSCLVPGDAWLQL